MGICCSTDLTNLTNLTYENTPKWTLAGRTEAAKVLRVVDGDTVDMALEVEPGKFFQFRVRLYGIDTPEKRPPKNSPNRDEEIAAAKCSTKALDDYLSSVDYIVDKAVFREADKYGRWLCDFYVKGVYVNEWMINNGYAKPYFGGKKDVFHVSEVNY